MTLGVVSGGTGWHVQDLLRAAGELGIPARSLDFRQLAFSDSDPLVEIDALIARTMPAGSLEQVVFRMDRLQEFGGRILNPPKVLETCVDKYLTDVRLRAAGVPIPKTEVCQTSMQAMESFERLGRDCVVKPLFGSEGRGMIHLGDSEIAWRTFRAIEHTGGVIYLQEFLKHPGWDLRVFVLGERILGAMKRTAKDDWRTNVAQGGTAEVFECGREQSELALKACRATGAIVAGVDLIQNDRGVWFVLEVNAVPGWKAFGAVSGLDVAKEIVEFAVTMP